MIQTPYLLFLGDAPDALAAKVAQGIRDWRPGNCVAQLRLPGCNADLGLPDLSLAEAVEAGARTLVIGVANRGGLIADAWIDVLVDALESGLDVASGLHNHLRDEPRLVAAAERAGRMLHDVRIPDRAYPIADGRARTGRRLLTVGTDCSVGKMYTTLALDAALRRLGAPSTFRATGQTGILITGDGVPLDAVVADFMSGAIEWLTPANDPGHWDLVEGQGSLFHVSFSGVTLALIHGARPDALVLCHEPTRSHLRGLPDQPVPSLEALRDLSLQLARIANPACQVVGASINTQHMGADEATAYCADVESRLGVPTVDPFRHGADRLARAVAEL
jgi:uncharacterized NAD-dependent epimerase/dehydratase family protein